MRSKITLNILALTLSLFACAAATHAQVVATGRIIGTVKDPNGALLAGVKVTVTEVNTSLTRTASTNAQGEYIFTVLPVGTYRLDAEITGFSRRSIKNIELRVDQTVDLEVSLEVGDLDNTVEVTSTSQQLEAHLPTLKTVIDQKRVAELPLEGRNILKLTLLVPGVQPATGAFINQEYTAPNQVFVSSSGGRGNTIVYNLDGVDNSDTYTNVANSYPNPDAIETVTIETNNYTAEHGRRGGGVVNAITRSGGNSFHGSLFEFARNTAMNATNFFTPGVSDGLKRHQFGGTFGGPIFKDKTFFFASYQRSTFRRLSTEPTAIVPTAAMRAGDFSNLRLANGNLVVIRDPNTGIPFPNNQIPTNRLDPISLKLLELIPLPTDPSGFIRLSIPNSSDDDQLVVRIDQKITDKNRLNGRYLYDRLSTGTGIKENDILNAVNRANFTTTNLTIADTHTFAPNLIGIFSATLNRLWSGKGTDYPTTLADLGANIVNLDPSQDIWLQVAGFFNINSVGAVILARNNYQFQGSFTYVKGRHELKFGADVINQQFNVPAASLASNGLNIFGGLYSGSNLSDFMLGRPSLFIQSTPWGEALRATQPAVYVQDNFQVTRRLSLNGGLRYEPYLPWKELQANKILKFLPGVQSQISPGLPKGIVIAGEAGVPEAAQESAFARFAPRLGFAYLLPNDKTSIRGGYGIFYDYPNAIINNRFASNIPFVVRVDVANPTSLQNPWTASQPNPFPVQIPVPSGFVFPRPATTVTYDDAFTNGYLQQWNLTVEHQIASNWLARASYMGSHGVHLMSLNELNPARYIPGQSTLANVNQRRIYAPDFASVQSLSADGDSHYNAAAITIERRFQNDYTLTASYTFGKSTDDQSNIVAHGQSSYTNPFDKQYDSALSDFDTTHRFVSSFIWQLPLLNDWNDVARAVLGGWQLNSIIALQSGKPFSVVAGVDNSLDGVGGDRPDLIGEPDLPSDRPKGETVLKYFNTAAFRQNAMGTFGTAGRNIIRGPGFASVDLSLLKNFRLPWFTSEGSNLQFRAEFYNLFNRTNFNNPVNNMVVATFGRLTSAQDPRIVQLALRLAF